MFGCFANKEQTICQAFSALKWKLAASLSLSAILKNSALKIKLHIYYYYHFFFQKRESLEFHMCQTTLHFHSVIFII